MKIELLKVRHYNDVLKLWKKDPGIRLSAADTKHNIALFIRRNRDTSLIAKEGNTVIGTILCGHDGRRGYFHHVYIDEEFRNKGLGRRLVNICIEKLQKIGITKIHIFILPANATGKKFWERIGFYERTGREVNMYSMDI